MARRLSFNPSGSMHMMLDTVTNAFGGVMFIALLLAVVSRQAGAGPRPADKANTIELSELDVEQLRQKVLSLERRLEESQMLERALREEDAESAARSRIALAKYAGIISERRTVGKEVAELSRAVQVLRETISKTKESARQLTKELESSREDIDGLMKEIDGLQKTHRAQLRLPQLRDTTRTPFWVILKGDRLYPCFRIDRSSRTWKEPHGSVSMSVKGVGWEYEAKPGAGQVIESGIEEAGYFQEIITILDPARHTVHFAVYPDSFGTFGVVRDHLVKRGFRYNWDPIKQDHPVTLTLTWSAQDQ